ncbi:MAG TPA: DHA2 family efflux MFS transporter permease subunit [Nocardioides sp.]|nr:DHA2 family efflux MFS transporter permease subunit [Nocardioides sp.]
MTAPTEEDDLAPKAFEVYDAELEAELSTGRTPLVIKLLVAATFVVILNETITVTALPRLQAHFGLSLETVQWVTTAFMLTMASVIPLTGWFLQRVSTRTAYATAMTLFSIGTLVAALAPSFTVIIVGRVIQASGTAVMMPLLMTTLMTVVPQSDRGRVMGSVTLAMSVAPAMGPAVSGVLLQLGSWRFIFIAVLPIAIAVGVLGLKYLENIGEPQKLPVSWLSVLLAATGFGTFVYGITKVQPHQWHRPALIIAAGAVVIATFVGYQLWLQRGRTPLLDLRTLKHGTYTKSLVLMAAAFMGFFGSMILLPMYFQNVRGLTPLQSGLMVMPGGLAMGLLGPRVGKLFDKVGTRPLVIPGSIAMVALIFALSQVTVSTPYWLLIVIHVALMASLAAIFTPVFSVGLGGLPPQLYSHGSSLLGALQQVAGAVGAAMLAVISVIRAETLSKHGAEPGVAFVGGMERALEVSAVIGLVVVLMAVLLPARPEEGAQGH